MNVFDRSRTARFNVPRSRQGGMSFTRTQTMDYGVLAPNYLQKVYPNDTFTIKTTNFMRTVPMVTPMLSRVRLFQRFYYVPFRILWEPFEKYIFGGSTGDFTAEEPFTDAFNFTYNSDNSDVVAINPSLPITAVAPQTLADYFNYPINKNLTSSVSGLHPSAFPFAAYHMIYSYGYRNENIQTKVPNSLNLVNVGTSASPAVSSFVSQRGFSVASLNSKWEDLREWSLVDGYNQSVSLRDDSGNRILSPLGLNTLHYVNFPLDYFTSLNPWQQRGSGGKIPVRGFGDGSSTLKLNDIIALFDSAPLNSDAVYRNVESSYKQALLAKGTNNSKAVPLGNYIGVRELSPSPVVTYDPTGYMLQFSEQSEQNLFINMDDFRLARAIQVMQEISARGGVRFAEGLQSFFGTAPSDARLQEPQFLGGFVQDLNVSEVIQQSEDNKTPLGTLGGKGTSAGSGTIRVHVKEHGLIMGLVHILPDIVYHQGFSREWNTRSRYDWFWPNLTGLSEQPVYGYELFVSDNSSAGASYNFSVLGYQGRYNELRWRANEVAGGFRDTLNITGSFEYYKPWVSLRTFQDRPTLSEELITSKNNISHDNFYVNDPDKMWPFMLDSYHKVRAVRPITRIPIPSRV